MDDRVELAVVRAVFEQVREVVVIADAAGVVIDANPAAIALFTRDALFGASIEPLVRGLREAGRDLEVRGLEIAGHRVTFVRDETELRHARKMEVLGQLSAGIAHDFNNVLAVIFARTAFLAEEAEAVEIRTAAESARSLVAQLLAFGRKQPGAAVRVCVNSAIEQFSRLLGRSIGEAIELVLDLGPDAGAVHIDEVQFQQILLNLAINARDAMPGGGKLTIATRRAAEHVQVDVTDTGVGMTDEVRTRIFEPFFTTKFGDAGTGLGLATVSDIVRGAGGTIVVASQPGQGASFRVTFGRGEAMGTKPPPLREPLLAGTESVLLVDDDELVLRAFEGILSRSGYQVIATRAPADALAAARAHKIDALVTDVVMPGTSGFAIADALRELRPEVKVLYLSGFGDFPDGRRGEASSFLAKPFSAAQLLRELRALIDS